MNTKKIQRITLFILLCGLFCIISMPVTAQQGSFSVTLSSFRVNQQTNEGLRAMDGANDEVKFFSHVGTINAAGSYAYGQNGPTPTIGNLTTATNPNERQTMPPLILFNGEIGLDTKAVLIIPTVWEWDNEPNLRLLMDYNEDIRRSSTPRGSVSVELATIIRNRPSLELSKFLLSGSSLGINLNTMQKLAGGIAQDRPIGMHTTGLNQFGFIPQGLVLTYESANYLSRTNFDFGLGVVPVRYVDAPGMGGDYIILLKVERTDEAPACPADFSSTFNGLAEMTITYPRDPKHPIGPILTNISLPVEFTECRTRVRVTDFPVLMSPPFPVRTPSGDRENITTITQTGGGTGMFTPGNGRLVLPITLHFQHSLEKEFGLFARASDLTLNLTTQEQGGSKKDAATGNIVMVASGQFSGGFLNGRTGDTKVTGTFSPRP